MSQRINGPDGRTVLASTSFILLGVEVVGHVLDDGTRIIEADALECVMTAMMDPSVASSVDLLELQRFSEWQKAR